MGMQIRRETVDKERVDFTATPDNNETALSRASRILSGVLFGLAICLLVTLLFLFGAALHQNHESMIFEVYGYLIWAGSLVLAALVTLAVFRS